MNPPQPPTAVASPPPAAPSIQCRSTEFTANQVGVLFLVVTLVVALPILTHSLPPLEDYVNHLARMHVIATVQSDSDLAKFYAIDWQIIPNLMMDMIVPSLARFMNIYLAGQVFIIAIFALILSGLLALNRALFGRWSVLPLVAAPLLYSYVFLLGYMNYLFGIGLVLWGLALWVLLREWKWPLRLMVSAAFVVGTFFCHLYAVGLYGMGLLAFEVLRLRNLRGPLLRRAIDFCATGVPFLPVIPLLLMSPTMDLSGENSWELSGKIDGVKYIIVAYSGFVAILLIASFIVAVAWTLRHKFLWIHPLGPLLLVIGTLVYFAMPRTLLSTYMADQRLTIALAFMVLACAHLDLRYRFMRGLFLVFLFFLLIVRVIEVDVAWADLSRATFDFRASVTRIKRGSTVLVAYADPSAGDDVRDLGLVHAACLAMIERSALVTTAFAVPGKQVLRVKSPYDERVDTEDGTPPSVEQLLATVDRGEDATPDYWQEWPAKFDYVYVLFTEREAANPAPALLTLLHEGPKFQLYQVNKPDNATKP
jgi:hypothetical protein